MEAGSLTQRPARKSRLLRRYSMRRGLPVQPQISKPPRLMQLPRCGLKPPVRRRQRPRFSRRKERSRSQRRMRSPRLKRRPRSRRLRSSKRSSRRPRPRSSNRRPSRSPSPRLWVTRWPGSGAALGVPPEGSGVGRFVAASAGVSRKMPGPASMAPDAMPMPKSSLRRDGSVAAVRVGLSKIAKPAPHTRELHMSLPD